MSSLEQDIVELCCRARSASRNISTLSTIQKNDALKKIALLLLHNKEFLQGENLKDLEEGRRRGLSTAMLDRLQLNDSVISSMINGLNEVAALSDPIGTIHEMVRRPSGIHVGRMTIPLGVIAMIYESRPNVTVDAAALCLKAGNSIILRGGKEAIHSNMALTKIIQNGLEYVGIDRDAVQVVAVTERDAVLCLLKQESTVDLIIPRGGESLIRFVTENSRVPVLKHYKGVCHIFVDKDADLEKAVAIIVNAKVQSPGVCNALEGLLVHKDIAGRFLPVIVGRLRRESVRLLGCSQSHKIVRDLEAAEESDWGTEFLDLAMCVKIVDGYDEAKRYIEKYGSNHTECILTENYSLAQRFVAEIDASAVIVNASTRFNDGGQLGLGAEIGISTTKLHAYGPMGLEELTSRKYVIFGNGQVRS